MEAKSAKVSIPDVEDCLFSLGTSAGGVLRVFIARGREEPFVGGEGIGNRAWEAPLETFPPLEAEGS